MSMNDHTDPDLVFDLDAARVAADSAPEPVGRMLTSMADALESLRERYRMAEVIADIARMKVRADDTPIPLKDGDKMPMILSWVCRTLAACLEANGAPNYFGWGWTDEETGKSYRVRVQHDTGKSPEQVAAEARIDRDAALDRVRSLEDRADEHQRAIRELAIEYNRRDASGDAAAFAWADEKTVLLGQVHAVQTERDAAIRDLAECRATLANERGEGEGPSEGWEWASYPGRWDNPNGWSMVDRGLSFAAVGRNAYGTGWDWHAIVPGALRGGVGGTAPTAREAMRAADLARSTP